jgi:diguanylate cyclase (GGDEF)-like protein
MDRLTLLSMQGGLLVFMGVVVYLAWRTQRRPYSDNGPAWFSAGYIVGGIGLLLQAYRGIIPSFFAIILGNFLFLMIYALMERAIAITTRRRSYMYWLLGLDVVLILSYLYFTYVKPDAIARTIEAVIITPVMQIPIWINLERCKERTIRPALRAMSVVLLLHVVMNLVRVIGVLLRHRADAWFTWTGVITVAGMAISFMWVDSLRIREELERRAMTDHLTGLLNRRGLEEFGARELSRVRRLNLPCSAMAVDLNCFKQINDTYGHSAGDDALRAVAAAIRASTRITDVVTRMGGDEFFVILPGSDEHGAAEICGRLRAAIQAVRVKAAGGQSFSIALSIGCVTLREEKITIEDLSRESDARLYLEKRSSAGCDGQTARPRPRLLLRRTAE